MQGQPPRVVQFKLDNRQSDQVQILRIMEHITAQYAQEPLVREFTVSLLRGLPNNDLVGQTRRLIQFVRDKVTYVRDPDGAEYIVSPTRLLQGFIDFGYMAGDCDDHVVLLNTMLLSIGIPARPVGVKFGGADDFNHVISSISLKNETVLVDPCAKGSNKPTYFQTLYA